MKCPICDGKLKFFPILYDMDGSRLRCDNKQCGFQIRFFSTHTYLTFYKLYGKKNEVNIL